jgi:thiol peroxidase
MFNDPWRDILAGTFQFYDKEVRVAGSALQGGEPAPEFIAVATDWSEVKGLQSTAGKVRIIGSLPSLNTSVCDRETRRFNQEAAGLSQDIAIIMLSMDLPYTLKNWCAAAGVDQVITLSDHKYADFGEKYGVLLVEPRIHRRAIFVVDGNDKLVYVEYMPTNRDEPKYSEVIAAAQSALS